MYKHDTLFFYPFIFIWFFFLVYITSILLLTYDKGHRLRTFYTYSMYIKVWCKKFACRRQWHWPGVYVSPCSLALVLYWNYIQICHYRYWYPNPNHGWLCPPTKCEWGGGGGGCGINGFSAYPRWQRQHHSFYTPCFLNHRVEFYQLAWIHHLDKPKSWLSFGDFGRILMVTRGLRLSNLLHWG